jgi:hypothetical protein
MDLIIDLPVHVPVQHSINWKRVGIKSIQLSLLVYDYSHNQISYDEFTRQFYQLTGTLPCQHIDRISSNHRNPSNEIRSEIDMESEHEYENEDRVEVQAENVAPWSVWSWLSSFRPFSRPVAQPSVQPSIPTDHVNQRLDLTCCICTDQQRNIVILPCKHSSTCEDCTEAIQRGNNLCPICRGEIEDMIKYHNS